VQVIHPMRVKTPTDLQSRDNIHDGVEIGASGEPVAYWIKRTDTGKYTSDSSKNYLRIPARKAHRWNMIHGFIQRRADQVRGVPFFAPAMKFFRDLHDYLDAELVANVVTAAYALFIETGVADPQILAEAMAYGDNDGNAEDLIRYEEIIPGSVMYGLKGQKPHAITANRPGTTFEPFVKEIKKALAMALNMPYASLFKDVENVTYAGFRSAMLEAWRVFIHRRNWLSTTYCGRTWPMLQEEAWLRGDLDGMDDFYERMAVYCACEWSGQPKGQIEPVKEIQAEVLAVKNRLKPRRKSITELGGGDWRTTHDQIEEEERDLEERGLSMETDTGELDTTTDEKKEDD
ncbi:MAG: phage portal protein, partial [Desulfobacteraceae bacterium]